MNRTKTEDLIARHEGVRNQMYKDSKGIETIGIGHNLREPISDKAVSQIFQDDLDIVLADVRRVFLWFDELDDVRQAAVIDMVFNMGLPTFQKFRNTISFLERGEYISAAAEILRGSGPGGKSRYYDDVGVRAERISRMLETGEWQ